MPTMDETHLEAEPLLNDSREFTNLSSFLTQHVLGPGGHNDDVGFRRAIADLDSGVTVFGEFSAKELVEFGVENAISHKLQTK